MGLIAAAAIGGVENDDVVVATLSIESLDELTVALCTSLSLEAPLVSSVSMGCVLEDGLRWKKFLLALFFSVAMGSGFLIGLVMFFFLGPGMSLILYGSGGTGVLKVTGELGSHMFLRCSAAWRSLWKAWCFSLMVRGCFFFCDIFPSVCVGLSFGLAGCLVQRQATAGPCSQVSLSAFTFVPLM